MTRPAGAPATPPPDTKDWTFVLDRPCEECGFDSAAVSGSEIPARIAATATAWVEVLGRPGATARPDEVTWSPLEYACHVRDVYRVFSDRAQLMLSEDGPEFKNWDQDATALADRYWDQRPSAVAAELAATADRATSVFASVADDQWQRRGVRSNGSEFTIETLSRYFIHDVYHHLHDVGQRGTSDGTEGRTGLTVEQH